MLQHSSKELQCYNTFFSATIVKSAESTCSVGARFYLALTDNISCSFLWSRVWNLSDFFPWPKLTHMEEIVLPRWLLDLARLLRYSSWGFGLSWRWYFHLVSWVLWTGGDSFILCGGLSWVIYWQEAMVPIHFSADAERVAKVWNFNLAIYLLYALPPIMDSTNICSQDCMIERDYITI